MIFQIDEIEGSFIDPSEETENLTLDQIVDKLQGEEVFETKWK